MNHMTLKLSLLATAVWLGGCASSVKLDPPAPVENKSPVVSTSNPSNSANTQPAAQSAVASVDLTKTAPAVVPSVVYFDFDSYVVKDEGASVVSQQGKQLLANRGTRVMLEGHTDERGGREYNLALGQKRAEAVAKSLNLLGVQEGQYEAVSFGKERPADAGSDEAAWAKNRRVEIKAR